MKRLIFVGLTGLLTVLFVIAVWQDSNREWTAYQRQFSQTLARDERRGVPRGIQQVILNDLRRVDRCTTCHVAIDKPQLALAEQPFTVHPGRYLEWHPTERFACTVCHGGQGLATDVKAAHGDVKHWDEPLLRGGFVQASCRQCHGDVNTIAPYAQQLIRGQLLFESKGCYGCHAISAFGKEFGQTISSALSEIGSKPSLLIEADFEMMDHPHDRIHWLMSKLRHPRMLNPGRRPEELPAGEEEVFPSAMPHFGLTQEEIEALTTYLLSFRDEDLPASYVSAPRPASEPIYGTPEQAGRAVYDEFGCAACHGLGGTGGRKNWNSGLGQEIPSLLYVKAYYGDHMEDLKALIRDGRQPLPRADAERPHPPLYMPSWKKRISEEQLDNLVAYLFSLAQRLPKTSADSAAAADRRVLAAE